MTEQESEQVTERQTEREAEMLVKPATATEEKEMTSVILRKEVSSLAVSNQERSIIPMFIIALFPITIRWKEPKYPSTAERLNKMWHLHAMD